MKFSVSFVMLALPLLATATPVSSPCRHCRYYPIDCIYYWQVSQSTCNSGSLQCCQSLLNVRFICVPSSLIFWLTYTFLADFRKFWGAWYPWFDRSGPPPRWFRRHAMYADHWPSFMHHADRLLHRQLLCQFSSPCLLLFIFCSDPTAL
jgi:hypothetical protein